MRLLRDLWSTSPRRTGVLAGLVILWALAQAAALRLAGPVLMDRSWRALTWLAGATAVSVLTDLVIGLVAARLTADWTADVRVRLCRVALGQPLPTLEATPVGELLDRIDNDVYDVGSEVRYTGVRVVQSAVLAVAAVVTALVTWWPGGLVMALVTIVTGFLLRRRIAGIATARMAEEEAWSDLAAVTEEAIHGQDDVRTTLAQPFVLQGYARHSAEVLRRGRVVWRSSALVTLFAALATRGGIAAFVAGGAWALVTGRLDAARLTSLWLLALAYGNTVEHATRMVPELQYALGAWGRILQLASAPQEPDGGRDVATGDLELRGLTFHYPTRDTDARHGPALRDVRLVLRPGRSYALVGRSGSGKSTLAKVLSRAVEVPRGRVFLGGVDLADLDLQQLRRWVAVVPQRTEILSGTVAENIALFDPELLDRAAAALTELDLDDWIAELPDGIDTRLGDGGYVLSAGQEQLIAFARILVRDPHVVVLDEATARLDPHTERAVQRATERLLAGGPDGGRIGVLIAHRLSSVTSCDEVVVMADGAVVEAGPIADSARFAELLAVTEAPGVPGPRRSPDGPPLGGPPAEEQGAGNGSGPARTDPPPLPELPPVRTLREILRLVVNDARYGLAALGLFLVMMVFALDGAALPALWARLIGDGSPTAATAAAPAVAIVAALLLITPLHYRTSMLFPEWWVRQMLRIGARLVHGQTGPRRVSTHTPAEVVAQVGDTERVVMLADNVVDISTGLVLIAVMTVAGDSPVPGLFFAATMVVSALVASLFGRFLSRAAQETTASRAAFATALVSCLSAARTVKLAGATPPVLAHLARLDRRRSDRQAHEVGLQVWARSTPGMLSGLAPLGVWVLYLLGRVDVAATLVAVSTLGSARWFAWTAASLAARFPAARVWTRRTVAMSGTSAYSRTLPGVDLSAGTAPEPAPAPRVPLTRLDLRDFGAVHEDGTLAVRGIDLTVRRGELVLVLGAVGSGKSSLLRALAGIVHHTGTMSWNGRPVEDPATFLRPNQVGYVAQLPRVLSGTVADNIGLGREVEVRTAVSAAQLDHDLIESGAGLTLVIGHKGTRLSGGQLQRLALARALAPRTELLVADDVSSALDVTTELQLWRALRERGVTVIGSTSKRAALVRADRVVVLEDGVDVAQGTWAELEDRWGHLAG